MGRRYILTAENQTLNTGSILAVLASAAAGNAGSILEIERVEVSQSHNSTAAQVRLQMNSRDAAGTLTVAASTPRPLVLGSPASGLTGGTNGLTAATAGVISSADSGGTYTPCGPAFAPNNLGGYLWQPIPQHTLIVPPSKIWTLGFAAAPGDLAGWDVNVWFHEIF